MGSDDEALEYLKGRGIAAGVIEVLRAQLASSPARQKSQNQPQTYAPLNRNMKQVRKAAVVTERCQLAMLDMFGKIPSASEIRDDPLVARIGEWLNAPSRPWHDPSSNHPIPDKTTVRRAANRGRNGISLIIPDLPK